MGAYVKRLAEQAVVAFLAGAGSALAATDDLSKVAVVGALTAGVRAVYGLLVKRIGDTDRPDAV